MGFYIPQTNVNNIQYFKSFYGLKLLYFIFILKQNKNNMKLIIMEKKKEVLTKKVNNQSIHEE